MLHRQVRPFVSLLPLVEVVAPGLRDAASGNGWQPQRLSSSASSSASSPHDPSPSDHRDAQTIDFGYQEVPIQQKRGLVGQVFSSVAPSYDVMNDLMSAGLHRLWKDRLVSKLSPWPGMRHLDVAGGTGDVAFRVLRAIRAAEARAPSGASAHPGEVTVFDINAEMLKEGQRRADAFGLGGPAGGLHWVQGDAEELPFEDGSMDSYTVAFGIRNVTHRDSALAEAYRVLRPGGRFMCLEFSHVTVPGLREFYDAYSFNVIPQVGRLVAGDAASYQYLVESIRKFPDQEAFADMIHAAGFSSVGYENLTAGIVALHSGFKL